MHRLRILPLVLTALCLTGCDSKQVQAYATKLQTLLADYKRGVQARIDAERKMYDAVSVTFASEAERDVYEGLKVERLHQQRLITIDLESKRLAPAQVPERLRETAMAEFDRTRSWFDQELTAQQKYQEGLAKLRLDAKKIDALESALKAVQKNTGKMQALEDVLAFGGAFKKEFELQTCKDMERDVNIRSDSLSALEAELKSEEPKSEAGKALQNRIDTLKAAQDAEQTKLNADSHFTPSAADATKKTCQESK